MTSPSRRSRAVLIAALLAITGCTSDIATTAPTTVGPSTTTVAAPVATTTTTTTTTEVTAGPARARLDWLLGLINSASGDPATVAAGFAPAFLDQVTIDQLVQAVGSVVGTGTGWSVDDASDLGPIQGTAVIVSAEGSKVTVNLAVEPDGEHRITGLRLIPVIPEVFPADQPVTAEAFDAALRATAPHVTFGLYDVTDGECRLIHGVDPETPAPMGSAFKLWILAALATEIEAGRATWDETFPVTADLISSPDGEIASTAIGTPITLRHYAELMISVSDNSATDHLLHRLGRQTVEQAMVDAGVAHPERNIPLLSTREFFLIKRGRTLPAAEYLAMGVEARRDALDQRLAGVSLNDDPASVDNTSVPAEIDTIEWFASPLDECHTHLRLADLAARPGLAPVADILRINPGLPFEARWTDVRFKGGSEAGVAFASWRLADDSRVYVLAGGVSNPTAGLEELRAIATIAAGIRLADPG